ncbi:Lrp/AsnC family leucine-responsive transcriptional regulator [Sphingomonas sp. UYAg733]
MTTDTAGSTGLDAFDVRILDLLQENNQRTSEELATLVHLSPASCLRRVKKLREKRVIVGDVSIVAPERLGNQMTMIVLVSLESEQHHLIDALKTSMKRTPNVLQCYYVTGAADFVIVVSVKDMAEYEQFTRDFFFENRNVRRFETLVVMNAVKRQLDIKASEVIRID